MMFKFIAAIFPLSLLPKVHRTEVNVSTGIQSKIPYTEAETREHFEQIIRDKTFLFLTTYSGYRFLRNKLNEYKINKKSKLFYALMGELAVTHACIEQDLKNIIRLELQNFCNAFNHPYPPTIDPRIGGKPLQEKFLKIIENNPLISFSYNKYNSWMQEFITASELRNDTLKALYQFNSFDTQIQKIQLPSLTEITNTNNEEKIIELFHDAIKNIDLEDINKQIEDLKSIRIALCEIRSESIRIIIDMQMQTFYAAMPETPHVN